LYVFPSSVSSPVYVHVSPWIVPLGMDIITIGELSTP
jgi:hypothetical protein